jgi:hypothetical protein
MKALIAVVRLLLENIRYRRDERRNARTFDYVDAVYYRLEDLDR